MGFEEKTISRKQTSFTIRRDVLEAAKALELNTSRAAEAGIMQAIKDKQEQDWLKANKAALQAHNERTEEDGPLLKPDWA